MSDHTLVSLPAYLAALTGFQMLRVGKRKVWAYPDAMDQSVSLTLPAKALQGLSYEEMAWKFALLRVQA